MVNPGKDIKTANMSGEMDDFGNVAYQLDVDPDDAIPDAEAFQGQGGTPGFEEDPPQTTPEFQEDSAGEDDGFDDVPELAKVDLEDIDLKEVDEEDSDGGHSDADDSGSSADEFQNKRPVKKKKKTGQGRVALTWQAWVDDMDDIKFYLQYRAKRTGRPFDVNSWKYLKKKAHKSYKMDGIHLMFKKKGTWVEVLTDREETRLMMDKMHGENADECHAPGHIGRNYLRQALGMRFEWVRMTKDIDNYKASCVTCAKAQQQHLKKGIYSDTNTFCAPTSSTHPHSSHPHQEAAIRAPTSSIHTHSTHPHQEAAFRAPTSSIHTHSSHPHQEAAFRAPTSSIHTHSTHPHEEAAFRAPTSSTHTHSTHPHQEAAFRAPTASTHTHSTHPHQEAAFRAPTSSTHHRRRTHRHSTQTSRSCNE